MYANITLRAKYFLIEFQIEQNLFKKKKEKLV